MLERDEGGGIVFPFDAVKIEFMLQAAQPVSRRGR
jgi:hypothetical protein